MHHRPGRHDRPPRVRARMHRARRGPHRNRCDHPQRLDRRNRVDRGRRRGAAGGHDRSSRFARSGCSGSRVRETTDAQRADIRRSAEHYVAMIGAHEARGTRRDRVVAPSHRPPAGRQGAPFELLAGLEPPASLDQSLMLIADRLREAFAVDLVLVRAAEEDRKRVGRAYSAGDPEIARTYGPALSALRPEDGGPGPHRSRRRPHRDLADVMAEPAVLARLAEIEDSGVPLRDARNVLAGASAVAMPLRTRATRISERSPSSTSPGAHPSARRSGWPSRRSHPRSRSQSRTPSCATGTAAPGRSSRRCSPLPATA